MTIDSKSDFFTVNVLFRSLRNGKLLPENLWEESIILIKASSAEEALAKATQLVRDRRISYQVENGDQLDWEFSQVVQAFQIDAQQLMNGTELFSRHLRTSEVESLLRPFDD
ncbi:MAG: DUF4288 domain-containing protein [Betaproteobacteria bacterium]|nr:DUF4288 domain-containing protein [Betaproteobacteria bacterium]